MRKNLIICKCILIFTPTVLMLLVGVPVSWGETKIVGKYSLTLDGFARSALLKGVTNPGFGSGMDFIGINGEGEPRFIMVTDRGPNVDVPSSVPLSQQNAKNSFPSLFVAPLFTPLIATVQLTHGQAKVISLTPILTNEGMMTTGIPPLFDNTTQNIPLDSSLAVLPRDPQGIDPEGIAKNSQGEAWLCEEYSPSLLRVDLSTGRTLEKLRAGKELPQILLSRQQNRGFEGIAVSKKGVVFAALQSTLDVEGMTKNISSFIRILRYEPSTREVKTYAYPLTDLTLDKRAEVKLGDLAVIGEDTLLVIESHKIPTKKGKVSQKVTKIVRIDLKDATDITNRIWHDKPLEFAGDEVFGTDEHAIRPLRKRTILDLKSVGWKHDKTESLTIFPDNQTIAIAHDNDFGFSQPKKAKKGKKKKNDVLVSQENNKYFEYSGSATEIWVIRLSAPVHEQLVR